MFQNYFIMPGDYATMVFDKAKNRPVYIYKDDKQSLTAKTDINIRAPFSPNEMSTAAFLPTEKSVAVNPLPASMTIPTPVIASWPGGPEEQYAAELGWRYSDTIPKDITVSYLLDMRAGGMSAYHIVVGGEPKTATFPFSALLGLEERSAGSPSNMITITIDPSNIIFQKNKVVLRRGPLQDVFRGSLSHAGVVHDWKSGPGVYVR